MTIHSWRVFNWFMRNLTWLSVHEWRSRMSNFRWMNCRHSQTVVYQVLENGSIRVVCTLCSHVFVVYGDRGRKIGELIERN